MTDIEQRFEEFYLRRKIEALNFIAAHARHRALLRESEAKAAELGYHRLDAVDKGKFTEVRKIRFKRRGDIVKGGK